MQKVEAQLCAICPVCSLVPVVGAILEDWPSKLRERGLQAVFGLHPGVTLDQADGIFLGDLWHETWFSCVRCGAHVQEWVSVAYADRCGFCGCAFDEDRVTAYTWDKEQRQYTWLCESCEMSPAGIYFDRMCQTGTTDSGFSLPCTLCNRNASVIIYPSEHGHDVGLCFQCCQEDRGQQLLRRHWRIVRSWDEHTRD